MVFWLGILAFAATAVSELLHWILTDPDVDRDMAKDRFRLEQEYREFRRAGKITPR
jgi:hypothetical protein